MHRSECTCPKCRMPDELKGGQDELPGIGKVYDEVGFESPLSEAEELKLAAELLPLSSEEAPDQFLGRFFTGIGNGLKQAGRSNGKKALPVLDKGLKSLAKPALPIAGKVLGWDRNVPGSIIPEKSP